FLADQDVYATTIQYLRERGHDVVPVAELGLARADDTELLRVSHAESRIFLTRDRDFGNLTFVQALGAGVIFLRILPSTQVSVHQELESALRLHTEEELLDRFTVVRSEERRVGKECRAGWLAEP